MTITITRESPDSRDAAALVDELDAYLMPMYPPASHHGYSIAKLIERGVAFSILRVDGAPAACGGVEFFPTGYGELKRMYTRPAFRGRGLARMILSHLIDYTRAQGTALLRLETGIYQHEAIKLYERLGFYEIGPFGTYTADPLSRFYELPVGSCAA